MLTEYTIGETYTYTGSLRSHYKKTAKLLRYVTDSIIEIIFDDGKYIYTYTQHLEPSTTCLGGE